MNPSVHLARNARKVPDREALVCAGRRMTYREWDEAASRLAGFLRHPFALLVSAGEPVRFPHDGPWATLEEAFAEPPVTEDARDRMSQSSDEEIATILYTSGTTGKPKGVSFTFRQLAAVTTMAMVEFGINADARILHLMPLSHSASLHLFFLLGLCAGATHVLHPTFSPEVMLELVERERITHFFGAPVAYLLALQNPSLPRRDFSSVRCFVYGGAPMAAEQVERVRQAFGGRVMGVYGLTEAGPTGTLLRPEEHGAKSGSVGRRAALFTEVRVADADGTPAPPGSFGEIQLAGEGIMAGYWNDPEATRAAFTPDGWLRTGDVGVIDEEGYLWVVDRLKDVIITGGVNVYPREVEEVLLAHPDVADCAVIGAPHPVWGETVVAYVVPRPGAAVTEEALQAYCAERLADYKRPRVVRFVDALPRNASGKLLKHILRQQEAKDHAQP